MAITIDSPEERDTILAALRLWQEKVQVGDVGGVLLDIANNGGQHNGLDLEGIDDLCERLNTSTKEEDDEDAKLPSEAPEGHTRRRFTISETIAGSVEIDIPDDVDPDDLDNWAEEWWCENGDPATLGLESRYVEEDESFSDE